MFNKYTIAILTLEIEIRAFCGINKIDHEII